MEKKADKKGERKKERRNKHIHTSTKKLRQEDELKCSQYFGFGLGWGGVEFSRSEIKQQAQE